MNQTISIKPKIIIKTLQTLTRLECTPEKISKKLKVSPATWYRIRNTLKFYQVKIQIEKGVYKITDYGVFNKSRLLGDD